MRRDGLTGKKGIFMSDFMTKTSDVLRHLLFENVRWLEVGQDFKRLASFKGRMWTESEMSCILSKEMF